MPDYSLENEARARGFGLVCGVDEAGRGPLAGPVYAAAVILPDGLEDFGINDSKKLSEKKREELFGFITRNALAYSVASASVEEIDSLNILNATFLAMRRAVAGLDPKADFALIDGNRLPGSGVPEECVVKGDSKSLSVAAASVLAKVSRDRYMLEIAEQYPEYRFDAHKGYGTKLHYEMILKYGVLPVHRRTFLKTLKDHA